MIVAEGDDLTLWDLEIAGYNEIPSGHKKLVVLPHTTHMTLYSDVDKLAGESNQARDWFLETL